ncbi:MAG: Zn-ribbon domain-containing OB-fold protein [Acidimicrobiales bacterium]
MTVPLTDEESAGFWEGTSLGELRVQACGDCGRLRFPPRVMCPHCHSTVREWRAVSGKGKIWSFVVPHPPLLPAYSELAPYNVIVVELAEGTSLRLVGNLLTAPGGLINEVDPDRIRIGDRVKVVFSVRQAPDGSKIFMPEWVLDQST